MEFFNKLKTVRLRSRHGKYLWADEDECMISQSKDAAKKPNSLWTVEFNDSKSAIRLKSCYDCYLTATDVPYLLGMTGKKVLQMKLKDSDSSIVWEPIREGYSVKLKTPNGNYLRANISIPPWRNSVTHDSPHRNTGQDLLLWEVEPSETLPNSTSFKEGPIPSPKPSPISGRLICYSVADDDCDGEAPEEYECQFTFKGHDLHTLIEKLKEETGIVEDIVVCSHNRISNRLFPVRLQLPPNNTPMHLVIVKASSRFGQTFSEMVEIPGQNPSKRYSKSFSYSPSMEDD